MFFVLFLWSQWAQVLSYMYIQKSMWWVSCSYDCTLHNVTHRFLMKYWNYSKHNINIRLLSTIVSGKCKKTFCLYCIHNQCKVESVKNTLFVLFTAKCQIQSIFNSLCSIEPELYAIYFSYVIVDNDTKQKGNTPLTFFCCPIFQILLKFKFLKFLLFYIQKLNNYFF